MNTNVEYWVIIFIAAILFWNVLVLIASIIYRKYKMADQSPFDESNLTFNESWVSGSSQKNWFTRVGGARKCLQVSVNDEEIYIRPYFPFRFLFFPELLDLEHRIARENVISVKPSADLMGNKTTKITFSTSNGQARGFDLYLTNENKFTSLFS